jgi:hypothetical protein
MTRKLEQQPAQVTPLQGPPFHASPAVAPTPQQQSPPAPNALWQRAPMRFKADYKEVPGSGKDRVKLREEDDGLWVDLGIQSFVPDLSDSAASTGLVAGAGAKLIDTFSAPMTDGPKPYGTGQVSAHLHHADRLVASLDVTVSVPRPANAARARAEALKFITDTAAKFGDVDELSVRAVEHLATRGFPNAEVKIQRRAKATRDLGEHAFHYRVHGPSQILIDIEAAAAGESAPTTVVGSSEQNSGRETGSETHYDNGTDETNVRDTTHSSEGHRSHSDESVNVDHNRQVIKEVTEMVSRLDARRGEFVEHVTNNVTKHTTFNELTTVEKDWDEHIVGHGSGSKSGHTESGEKDRRNLWNDIKDVTHMIDKVVELPFLKNAKFIRQLKPWFFVLKGVDFVAGKLTAKGKVNVTDSKESSKSDADTKKDGHSNETTHHTGDRNETEDQRGDLKRNVEEASLSLWSKFRHQIKTTTDSYRSQTNKNSDSSSEKRDQHDYHSTNTKSSGGGSDTTKSQEQKRTTVTVSRTTVTKFTKPLVRATVVAGDCEVSTAPFAAEKDHA